MDRQLQMGLLGPEAAQARESLLAALQELLSGYCDAKATAQRAPSTPREILQVPETQADVAQSQRPAGLPPAAPTSAPPPQRAQAPSLQGAWAARSTSSKQQALANRLVGIDTATATPQQNTGSGISAPASAGNTAQATQGRASDPPPAAAASSAPPCPGAGGKRAARRIAPQTTGRPAGSTFTLASVLRGSGNTATAPRPQGAAGVADDSARAAPSSPTHSSRPDAQTPSSHLDLPPPAPTSVGRGWPALHREPASAGAAWHTPQPPLQPLQPRDGVLITPSSTLTLPPSTPLSEPQTNGTTNTKQDSNIPTASTECKTQPMLLGPVYTGSASPIRSGDKAWSARCEALATIHSALLNHGHSHTGIVDDVMQLITVLVMQHGVCGSVVQQAAADMQSGLFDSEPLQPQQQPQQQGPGMLATLLELVRPQFWNAQLAYTYVCRVLDSCSKLVCSLGCRVRGLLEEVPDLALSCPALAAAIADDRAAQSQAAAGGAGAGGPAVTLSVSVRGSGGLGGGGAMAAGGATGPEGQRQHSNREKARDAWHALAREASALAAAIADPTQQAALLQELQRMASGRQPSAPRSTGSGSNTGGNGTGSGVGLTHLNTLLGLQRRAQDLMACLHPDNLPFLADLLTTCVLQAAATGQAVIEGPVANLAQQDPARFARLSARMLPDADRPPRASTPYSSNSSSSRPRPKVPQGADADTAAPAPAPRRASPAAAGGLSGNTTHSRQDAGGHTPLSRSWPGAAANGGSGAGAGAAAATTPMGKDLAFASAARLARCVQLLDEFDSVQRGFVLIVELCDSQAFANALGRRMAAQLTSALAALPGWQQTNQQNHSMSDTSTSGTVTMSEDGVVSGGQAAWRYKALTTQQQRVLVERMTSVTTLSVYLSYLTHAHQPPTSGASSGSLVGQHVAARLAADADGDAGDVTVHWPAPTGAALRLLCTAAAAGMLPIVMPCVTSLLWHAPLDPDVLAPAAPAGGGAAARPESSRVRAALQALWRLRQSLALAPCGGTNAWGAASAVARTLVDGVLCRVAACAACAPHELPQVLGWPIAPIPPPAEHDTTMQPYTQGAISTPTIGDSTGALSLREDLDTRFALAAATPAPTHSTGSCIVPASQGALVSTSGYANTVQLQDSLVFSWQRLAVWDQVVDPWLLDLCIPSLDTQCRRLQRVLARRQHRIAASSNVSIATTPARAGRVASAAGTPGGCVPAGSLPATSPASPDGTTPASAAPAATVPRKVSAIRLSAARRQRPLSTLMKVTTLLPPAWATLLQSPRTPDKEHADAQQQLQQALLTQYSNENEPVKLRDVTTTVSEFVAANACALASDKAVSSAVEAAAAELARAAAGAAERRLLLGGATAPEPALQGPAHTTSASDSHRDATGQSMTTPVSVQIVGGGESGVRELYSATDLAACVDSVGDAMDDIASRAVRAALAAAESACREHAQATVCAALDALLPPTWPAAVRACGKAMTVQWTLTACAQRLSSQVPAAIVKQLQQQVEPLCKAALKTAVLAGISDTNTTDASQSDLAKDVPSTLVPAASNALVADAECWIDTPNTAPAKQPCSTGQAAGLQVSGSSDAPATAADGVPHAAAVVQTRPQCQATVVPCGRECGGCDGNGGACPVQTMTAALRNYTHDGAASACTMAPEQLTACISILQRALEGVHGARGVDGGVVESVLADTADKLATCLLESSKHTETVHSTQGQAGKPPTRSDILESMLQVMQAAADAAGDTGARGACDAGRVAGPAGVAHVMALACVAMFSSMTSECRMRAASHYEPKLVSERCMGPHADIQICDDMRVLLRLPARVIAVGTRLDSLSIVHRVRVAMQTATMPGLA